MDEGKQVELVTSSGIDLEALQKLDLSQKNHTIFLYTGGPGPIEEFYKNSGYVLELAKYYGVSNCSNEHRSRRNVGILRGNNIQVVAL